MLRIKDFAERHNCVYTEVMQKALSDESLKIIIVPTNGEIKVFQLGDDDLISKHPEVEPISVVCVECEINKTFLKKLSFVRFPFVVKSRPLNIEGDKYRFYQFEYRFYQFDDLLFRPPSLKALNNLDELWFAFSKDITLTLDHIWIHKHTLETADSTKVGSENKKTRKSRKSYHVLRDIFYRAFDELKKNHHGEDPSYRSIWNAIYEEWFQINENRNISTIPQYDVNEIITEIDPSSKPNAHVEWFCNAENANGSYKLSSLPALITRYKKNKPS